MVANFALQEAPDPAREHVHAGFADENSPWAGIRPARSCRMLWRGAIIPAAVGRGTGPLPARPHLEPDAVVRWCVVVGGGEARRLDAHLEREPAPTWPDEPPARTEPDAVLGSRAALARLAPRPLEYRCSGDIVGWVVPVSG